MRNFSDDPQVWENENTYFNGLGATTDTTTPAPAAPSWWQNLLTTGTQAYTAVKTAQAQANTAQAQAAAAKAPVVAGSSTIPWGTYAAIGGGAILLGLLVFGKKRR